MEKRRTPQNIIGKEKVNKLISEGYLILSIYGPPEPSSQEDKDDLLAAHYALVEFMYRGGIPMSERRPLLNNETRSNGYITKQEAEAIRDEFRKLTDAAKAVADRRGYKMSPRTKPRLKTGGNRPSPDAAVPVKITYTIPEAIVRSGIGKTYLYKLFKTGELTPRKCGRRTFILAEELEQFLKSLPVGEFK